MDFKKDNDDSEKFLKKYILKYQERLMKHSEEEKHSSDRSDEQQGSSSSSTRKLEEVTQDFLDSCGFFQLYNKFHELALELQKYEYPGFKPVTEKIGLPAPKTQEQEYTNRMEQCKKFLRALLSINKIEADMEPENALTFVSREEFPLLSDETIKSGLLWYIWNMRNVKDRVGYHDIVIALVSGSYPRNRKDIKEMINWINSKHPHLSKVSEGHSHMACDEYLSLWKRVDLRMRDERKSLIMYHQQIKETIVNQQENWLEIIEESNLENLLEGFVPGMNNWISQTRL